MESTKVYYQKLFFFFILSATTIALALTGCARVQLDMDDDEIILEKTRGYVSPERSQEILEQQAWTGTFVAAHEKLTAAIKSGNKAEMKEALEMLGVVFNGTASVEYRFLKVRNNDPDYAVTMLNGPFAGETLGPSEKTKAKKPFPVGVFEMKYKWHLIGKSSNGTKKVNVHIGQHRTAPIAFNPQ